MTPATALDWLSHMLWTGTLVAAPVVLVVVIVGLIISILQAATQVNDAAVGFAPKIVSVMLTLVVLGEWMLLRLRDFAALAIGAMAHIAHNGGA